MSEEKIKREKQIGVSLSDQEYELIRKYAFFAKKSISRYVRDAVLEKIYKEENNGDKMSKVR